MILAAISLVGIVIMMLIDHRLDQRVWNNRPSRRRYLWNVFFGASSGMMWLVVSKVMEGGYRWSCLGCGVFGFIYAVISLLGLWACRKARLPQERLLLADDGRNPYRSSWDE